MTKLDETDDYNPVDDLADKLEKDMLTLYHSPLLVEGALVEALGYRSLVALREAIRKRRIGVPIFKFENRHGKYALVKDVARYLAEKRFTSTNLNSEEVCHD